MVAWDSPDIGLHSAPAMADLDNDGDDDLIMGGYSAGTPGWSDQDSWDIVDVGDAAAPAFADLDHDGDYDVIIGNSAGTHTAYENEGSVTSPSWVRQSDWDNADTGDYSQPSFSDLDNDGDIDMITGNSGGQLYAYENTGSPTSPTWTRQSRWDGPTLDPYASSTMADLDNDGDYDMIVCEQGSFVQDAKAQDYGDYNYDCPAYENTGSVTEPNWVANTGWNGPTQAAKAYVVENQYTPGWGWKTKSYYTAAHARPALADLDSDGDYDLIVGRYGNADQRVWENTGTPTSPIWTRNASWDGPEWGAKLHTRPALADLDGDIDPDLASGHGDGLTYTYENTANPDSVIYTYENTNSNLNPVWSRNAGWDPPDVANAPIPAMADLDNDGDYDLIIGDITGQGFVYENTGGVSSPTWTDKDAWDPPDGGRRRAPDFVDLDGDSDYDMLSGDVNGVVYAYENAGSVSSPSFARASAWDTVPIRQESSPQTGDLDNDGDTDLHQILVMKVFPRQLILEMTVI